MAELLLEFLCEEIPARMQTRAGNDLARLVVSGLKEHGLEVDGVMNYTTPRRLVLHIKDVPEQAPKVETERKGPRVGAPEKALAGFMKAAGISSIEDAQVVSDTKKGDFYVVKTVKPARPAAKIIAEVVTKVCADFPWPKSMHWGEGTFQWVRPLRSILCILDGKVVPFEIAGIASGNKTCGHRFHGGSTFVVKDFEQYGKSLKTKKVLLPASERMAMILEEASELAVGEKLELVADEGLLGENAGLVEWPVVLMGTFDKEFLDVPAECLTTSMKLHQKCFSLVDPSTGKLTNRFILVSNLIASDGGKVIVAGNEKVIRARLADAKFFWQQDLKHPLDEMVLGLSEVTFHDKLGTQKERVERIAELAHEIAGCVDADEDDARRAAQLCKADLNSQMVGEFPELQGLMGRYYAQAAGAKPEIARALELHYKPKGPTDTVPMSEDGDQVAIAVALADKLDTLSGFWAIDEKPTGSGDPYQLRRAALGVIRILIENDLRLSLSPTISRHMGQVRASSLENQRRVKGSRQSGLSPVAVVPETPVNPKGAESSGVDLGGVEIKSTSVVLQEKTDDLLAFFADRLKVYLRDQGKRYDLIDAVFALPGQDDLALVVKRVEALSGFLGTEDGENLLAGAKRAANILRIEEKKDKTTYSGEPLGALLVEPAERSLAAAIAKVKFDTKAAIDVENFDGAMRALSELRAPVDAFFEHVTVNTDDSSLRVNRLKLLAQIRDATFTVADFSKISG